MSKINLECQFILKQEQTLLQVYVCVCVYYDTVYLYRWKYRKVQPGSYPWLVRFTGGDRESLLPLLPTIQRELSVGKGFKKKNQLTQAVTSVASLGALISTRSVKSKISARGPQNNQQVVERIYLGFWVPQSTSNGWKMVKAATLIVTIVILKDKVVTRWVSSQILFIEYISILLFAHKNRIRIKS